MFRKTAAYYDLLYSFKDYEAASLRIRAEIEHRAEGARTLLDVACGTGRHLQLLGQWYRCEGLDLDEGLLEVARARNLGARLHHGDMSDFQLHSRFDVVTCLFSSIGYVRTLERMRRAVACMAAHLEPGGILLVEPWVTPEQFWPRHIASNNVGTDDLKVAWMYSHAREGDVSIFDIHYLVGRPEGVEHFTERHEMGLFSHSEYHDALSAAGLEVHFEAEGPFGRGLYIGQAPAVGIRPSSGRASAASREHENEVPSPPGPPLAVLGGEAAFSEPLRVGRPNIGDRKRLFERMDDLLDRRLLTNGGRYEQEFEERIAEAAGVRHCIATTNGTVALELAARALDLRGEVILPSFTFVATAHALEWQGITPVFADIDPATHNLSVDHVESLVTPRTSGVVGVHVWGRPCDVEGLGELSRRHGLALLFDAAHAFGCTHGGTPIGSFGDAEVFSFHATKFLNSFEGGAVVTDSDELAARVRLMRNFGFADYDAVTSVGINGKLTEAAAAMGLTSLESMGDFIEINRANHARYLEGLEGLSGISVVRYEDSERSNFQYVIIEVDAPRAGLGRDELQRVLEAENVLARRYFFPGCHRMEPYASRMPTSSLPNTEALAARVLSLPTGTAVTLSAVGRICEIIRTALTNADAVREALAARATGGNPSSVKTGP